MNIGEFMEFLKNSAMVYRLTARESIARNDHTHALADGGISQAQVDAVLADFLNWLGAQQGVEYGFYPSDLKKEQP